jgi:hypothetical protein
VLTSSFIEQTTHEGSRNGHIYSENLHADKPVSALGKSAGEAVKFVGESKAEDTPFSGGDCG